MIGAVKAVCASVLKVGAKGDGVGRRAVRGETNDQDVARSRHRCRIDRSCRVRRTVDDAGVALGGVKGERNRRPKRLRRGRHIDRRAGPQRDTTSRDRGSTRTDGQATSQRSTAGRNRDAASSDGKPASSDRGATSSDRQSTRADR